MPGRHGYSSQGGWASGTSSSGSTVPADLSLDRRFNNEPSQYKASHQIEFIQGFGSSDGDSFETFITDGTGTGGSNGSSGSTASGSYRYGFNGKEADNEVKGEGNEQDYGMRIYDPRLCRFLSVDPLTKSYPWYTPYSFAGNKPIWAIDLDGEEEVTTSILKFIFGSPSSNANPKTPLEIMTKERLRAQTTFANSPTGRFLNGAYNTTAGLVGAVGSVSYMVGSEGTGAALGGAVAFQFSVGQASLGISQMVNALFGSNNNVLDNSSSIPGLIAYGVNSKQAAFVDAVGGLVPSLTMSGGGAKFLNLAGYTKNGFGVVDAAKTFWNTGAVVDAFALFDQIKSVQGFVVESFNLASEYRNGVLAQKLSYQLNYTVKKGDNLTSIAKTLHTTVDELTKQNGVEDANKINEGQTLRYKKVVYGAEKKKDKTG